MSLLMDALRKAEQEKKAAAERLRAKEQSITGEGEIAAGNQSGLTLSLADDDDDDKGQAAAQSSAEDDTPAPEDTYTPGDDPDATLAEPVENLALRPAAEGVPESREGREEESGVAAEDSQPADEDYKELSLADSGDHTASGHGEKFTIDMSDEAGAETLGADSGKGHDDTLVVERAGQQPSRYEDSATLSETLEQTRTYSERPETEATREYAAADTASYTPVSAQNVFAARKSSSYATITVGILVMLVVIGLAAYGVFYYFSVTPIHRDLPSPAVARGVESTEVLPIVTELPAIEPGTEASDTAPPELPAQTPVVEWTGETGHPPEPETPPAPAEPEGLSAEGTDGGMVALPAAERPSEPVKPAAEPVTDRGREEQPSAVAEELELKPELLQISRSTEPAQSSQALVDAYHAFRRGDIATARSLYGSVHEDEPDNLNALLGLAAIAVRNQDYGQAYAYYSSVLRLNPANAAARAALINLQQQADPAVSESRIKTMLREHPESGYLYYALGNVYSRQQRWPDAQQAYFNAHNHDSENPDYALNLAISLDHMNKNDAAVDYYNKALELAEDGNAGFDADVIRQRVRELEN